MIMASIVVVFLLVIDTALTEKYVINLTISEGNSGGKDLINLRTYIAEKKLKIKTTGSLDIISNDQDTGNHFILDSRTGQLKLRSQIDREAICKHGDHCRLVLLVAVDGQVLEVFVNIADVNDNSPQFTMRYKTLVVQENSNIGLEMSLPTAEDLDSEENGISRYYIEDSPTRSGRLARFPGTSYFRIVEKTINNARIPYLKTIKEIDREEVDHFEMILVAEDTGKQRGSCTVTINVADVNDNSPQWPTASIYKKVRECERQGPLLELQAFDRDDSSTANGQIKYRISEHSPKIELINRMFYIAGANLFLSSNSLQTPEVGTKIGFFITAMDGGERENDTAVLIEIEDCNDHAPTIQLTRRSATVIENYHAMIVLTTVTVKDDDRDVNSHFSCDLNDTSVLSLTKQHSFQQPTGGLLVMYQLEKMVDVAFDREKQSYYSVLIRCIDQGRPSLTGEKMFSISIIDQNDNAPRFPGREARFSISENNMIGSVIGHVKAIDLDSIENGRITYQILYSLDNVYFSITNYGRIEAKWKFDRETRASYNFTVVARDNGIPSLNDTCDVTVVILDANDCLPTFKQQYFYQITESNGPTTIYANLGKVLADDDDSGENGTVIYEIRQSMRISKHQSVMARPILKISGDGTLSIYGVVDRESFSSIQAEVTAVDKGKPPLSSVTTVIVNILDLNDNKPRFKSPMTKINYVNVSVDTAVGSIVASVEAEDPDKGENGTVSYSIIGQRNNENSFPFQLQQDGRLILVKSIRERDASTRLPDRLLIKASDGGVPPLSDMLTLHMRYVANDRRPKENLGTFGGSRVPITKMPTNSGVIDGYRENEAADNMILLYILAGVLFTVFLIVLLVLIYTYFSGRFTRARHFNHSHEKQLNNFCNDGPGSHECELLTAGSTNDGREDFHKVSTISMSFPTVEKGHYTHLMMDDSKYTPIQITPNYMKTMCSPTSTASQSQQPFNYDLCNQIRIDCDTNRSSRLSNKWNSIENISQCKEYPSGINRGRNNNSLLTSARSYAAYINQFGKEDSDTKVWIEDNGKKSKEKQQIIPVSFTKVPKEEPPHISNYQALGYPNNESKKCYVTSSFV